MKAVVLVTSNAKAGRYLALVRSALKTFWPSPLPTRFLIDGGIEPAADVYIEPEPRFVPLLARGLARLRVEFPDATHVFHILEDHCPLRVCDAQRISAVASIGIDHDFAAVSFPTYQWPWNYTDKTEYPDGLLRVWRRIDTREIAGELLGVVPKDYFRYFQLQPTMWRLSYLEHACAAAIGMRVLDPWQFEAIRLPRSEQHYVSRYNWPTVHHGFLAEGAVNPAAIDFVDRRAGNAIRRQLVRELIGPAGSATLFELKRTALHNLRRIKKTIRSYYVPQHGN